MPRLQPHLLLLALLTLGGCSHLAPLHTGNSAAPSGKEAQEALRLAHVLRDNGRLEAAYEVYERMDERRQLHGAYMLEYASVASTIRPPKQALELFRRAAGELGQDLSAMPPAQRQTLCSGTGRAHLALGMAIQAERDFQCALDVKGDNPQALNGMGVALNLQGKGQQARSYFEKALEIDPGYSAAVNNLALAWLADGDSSRAIGLLNQSRSSGDVAIELNLALAYVLAGHDDTAQKVLLEKLPADRTRTVMEAFMSARERVRNGAPLASELLAASKHPFTLNDKD